MQPESICKNSQVQIIEVVQDVPVTKERMVPMVSTVQKTVEIPQVQISWPMLVNICHSGKNISRPGSTMYVHRQICPSLFSV